MKIGGLTIHFNKPYFPAQLSSHMLIDRFEQYLTWPAIYSNPSSDGMI